MESLEKWFEENDKEYYRVRTIEYFNRANLKYGPEWSYYNNPELWLEKINVPIIIQLAR